MKYRFERKVLFKSSVGLVFFGGMLLVNLIYYPLTNIRSFIVSVILLSGATCSFYLLIHRVCVDDVLIRYLTPFGFKEIRWDDIVDASPTLSLVVIIRLKDGRKINLQAPASAISDILLIFFKRQAVENKSRENRGEMLRAEF